MNERLCFPYKDEEDRVEDFVIDIEKIYNKMEDDISKEIFINRLLFSFTGNQKYLKKILLNTTAGEKLNKLLDEKDDSMYIYGAGIRGKRLAELFPEKKWGGIIDKNSSIESYQNIKVINLDEFVTLYKPGIGVLISNLKNPEEIVMDLLEKHVLREDIYMLNDFEHENAEGMYFASECIGKSVDSEKCFVDIGCYDGKDSLKYLEWCKNKDAKIYAFEPDKNNFNICKKNLEGYSNINLLNIGLSNVEENVTVLGEGEMSHLARTNEQAIQTQLLDNVIKDQEVGFVKMDVEGYEENVLKGAGKIIRKECPVMAISIYHKRSDIWRLPNLLLEYNENYSFYMRHYSATIGDTVLYAINKN